MGQLHGVDHIQGADPGSPGVEVEWKEHGPSE